METCDMCGDETENLYNINYRGRKSVCDECDTDHDDYIDRKIAMAKDDRDEQD